jgi:uncharacterized OsmC-like protein
MSTAIASQKSQKRTVNGVDPLALRKLIDHSARGGCDAQVKFAVATHWRGGAKSETRVEGYEIAGKHVEKDYSILVDEPKELCGGNTHPNPQEMLMAAFNACMLVGYVAGATVHGIELESLTIETQGELDLRGFLGLDPTVRPGYDQINYTVKIKGTGTPQQFEAIHQNVIATSPNRFNLANPIRLTSDLVVE